MYLLLDATVDFVFGRMSLDVPAGDVKQGISVSAVLFMDGGSPVFCCVGVVTWTSARLCYSGLPLWLPIRNFEAYLVERFGDHPPAAHNLAWVPEYFARESDTRRWGLDAAFFQSALHDPDNLLLVDGLDEARSGRTAQLFAELANTCSCVMVLTLRPEAESAGRLPPKVKARFPIRGLEERR